MKIVLTNLPWKKGIKWGVRAGSRWPHIKDSTEKNYLPFPFYLAYAAALLKRHGFDVYIIDAIAEEISYKKFIQRVKALKPQLVVAETSTVSLKHDLNFLENFKGLTSIALCGPDVNIVLPEFLAKFDFIDYVLFGEYEATLLDLVKSLKETQNLQHIDGIIYRNNGNIIKNGPRTLISDLDWLPWPLREALPVKKYNDAPGDIPSPCGSMWASRGCPFKCSFCLWPQVMYSGNSYRPRKIVHVVDEMEYLVKNMGFKSIYFDDDTWNIGRNRILAFCEELLNRDFRVPWAIMARAELMDEKLLERLRQAGLFAVKYGVESASQQLLNNISKGTDLKRVEDIIKYTKYLGIRTHLTFTFGLPAENKHTIRETINYAIKMDPTSVQFSLATPFPGTRFYEQMEKGGYILTKNWEKYDGNHHSVIKTDSLSAGQLQKAKKMAYLEWDKYYYQKKKKLSMQRETLQTKFFRSLKLYGLMCTSLKVIAYLLKQLVFLPYRIREFFTQKMWIEEESISNGSLKLGFGEGKVRLFYKNQELTKDVGLTTSLHCGQRWFDSSQGYWKLEKQSKNEIKIKLRWEEIPVRQEWLIRINNDATLFWTSYMQIEENLEILEYKAGIMVQDTYNMWSDNLGEGRFSKIIDWEEVELYNPNSHLLKVKKVNTRSKRTLPELELKLVSTSSDTTYPQIQNTTQKIKARLLQMRRFKIERFTKGIYHLFDLEISVNLERLKPQTISDYKQRVPFRFIKEKIQAKGVLNVIAKVFSHLHLKKIRDYYLDIIGILDGSFAYKGPSFVQIDLTNDCNNDCIGCWCNSPLLKEKRINQNVKRQTLPFEVVKHTVDNLHKIGTKEIYFAGGGEPFMHPQIMEIIEYTKSKGLRCYINTNFTLLTEDMIRRIVELQVDNLVVSIWAGSAKTYLATHPNKSEEMFYQLKGMLKFLNFLKKEILRVNIYNVISNLNYHELESMVDFAVETNSDSVEFTVIDTIPDATDKLLLTDPQRETVLLACQKIKRRLEGDLKSKIKILQFEQFIRRVENKDAKEANYDKNILNDMPCYIGWLFSRILADGNVNFCLKAHRIPVGNVYAHDFSYIWNGKKQQEFRKRALCASKEDVFFSFIGNDPNSKVGCFRSCDDLARNVNLHKKIQSLTSIELHFLKIILLFRKIARYRKNKILGQIIKGKMDRNKMYLDFKSQGENLRLVPHPEGIRIYWRDVELTQSVGLNTSVCIFGLWYDSSKARWEFKKQADDEFEVYNIWQSVPITQKWQIKLKGDNVIQWQVSLFIDSKIEIEESKISIMIPTSYKHWLIGDEKGKFSTSMDWQQAKIKNLNAKTIMVKGVNHKGHRLPGICFDFCQENGNIRPQLQNSDKIINARIVSASRIESNGGKVFLPGEYKIFNGKILVSSNDV